MWCSAAASRGWALGCFGRFTEAESLLNQAWARAERARHGPALYVVAWTAQAVLGFFRSDLSAMTNWTDRALQHDLLRGAVGQRSLLLELWGARRYWTGDIDAARQALTDVGALPYGQLEALLEAGCGDEERALRILTTLIEGRSAQADRWDATYFLQFRAGLLRARGELVQAAADLATALITDIPIVRMWASLSPVVSAEMGGVAEARAQVDQLERILDEGQDWRGTAAVVVRADAVVRTAEGDHAGAEAAFARALDVVQRYPVPWREAETLHDWGRARLAAGDIPGAREKLAECEQLYTRLQAGPGWLERVRADLAHCSH